MGVTAILSRQGSAVQAHVASLSRYNKIGWVPALLNKLERGRSESEDVVKAVLLEVQAFKDALRNSAIKSSHNLRLLERDKHHPLARLGDAFECLRAKDDGARRDTNNHAP